MTTIYEFLAVGKGKSYKPESIKRFSWLKRSPEVSKQPSEISGKSRVWGDISLESQARVIDLTIEICTRYKLSYRETAYVLLMARVESGFNPDAAAGTTSAAGIAQYTDATIEECTKPIYSNKYLGFTLDLSEMNVFDAQRGVFALLLSYLLCAKRAKEDFPNAVEENTYLYHHEGWYFKPKDPKHSDTVSTIRSLTHTKILNLLDETEKLLNQNAKVQFSLTTADGKPYANQPFALIVAEPSKAPTPQPASAQHSKNKKVITGTTDGAGKTPSLNLPGLSEVVFSILNFNYKPILTNFPGRGSGQLTSYTIRKGDSLAAIAKIYRTTPEALAELNKISNPNKIDVGKTLRVPDSGGESKPAVLKRTPPIEWLASIIGPHIGSEGVEDTKAVVEHVRSHVVLPNGNKAHDVTSEHNNICISGNKTAEQVSSSSKTKVPHKTNENNEAKQVKSAAAPTTEKKVITGLLYPLAIRATADYHKDARRFGASRGHRKHAGIDLYAPAGTIVRAMANGVVILVRPFYMETWVIEINHGNFIARYGELDKDPSNIFVENGDKVSRGDKIGKVGKLVGIKVPSNMLHLEMYTSTKKSPLTVRENKPFERREDLFDPTHSIDESTMN